MYGGKYGGEIESIPIAATGNIKVVSVDYRMAPEYHFPAATDDVVAVYKSLLDHYRPENIGIYGCSAGAILTAQTIARLEVNDLPLPGAIGLLGGGAQPTEGDSYHLAGALFGFSLPARDAYAGNADPSDPLVTPGSSATIMRKFPPTLLVSATRDLELSPVVVTHAQLVALGVPAELHVWEGQDHCFQFDPDLTASQDAYRVIAKFFESHLGTRPIS